MSIPSSHEELTAMLKARQEHIRETWIKAMETRLYREELIKCFRGEGSNHGEACKELAERYMKALDENRIKGFNRTEWLRNSPYNPAKNES